MILSKKKISELEFKVIENVKRIRELKDISKMDLSKAIGVADSFVGKVESYAHPDKYNINHLHKIALKFGLKSLKPLLPDTLTQFDDIQILYQMVPKKNKDGSLSKQLETQIIEIIPIRPNPSY